MRHYNLILIEDNANNGIGILGKTAATSVITLSESRYTLNNQVLSYAKKRSLWFLVIGRLQNQCCDALFFLSFFSANDY